MSTLLEDSTARFLDIVKHRKIPADEYNVVFMGDSWVSKGVGADQNEQRELTNPSTTGSAIFLAAMEEAKKYNPLCIIHGGDAVFNGSKAQLTFFRSTVQNPAYAGDIPIFITIGNHDVYDNQQGNFSPDNYRKIIGDLHYSISDSCSDPYHFTFISLNNVSPDYKTLPSSEIDFLVNTLNDPAITHRNCFVGMHVPPMTDKWTDGFVVGRDELYAVLSQGKVRNLLVSHRHEISTDEGAGVEFILSGAGGAPLFVGQTFAIIVFTIKNIMDKASSIISYKIVPIGWSA
ncbi:MAG: metallophosphoesterase [Bacillota bacterium]|nr:metallophosphoesterase [Bacillota bacterium]